MAPMKRRRALIALPALGLLAYGALRALGPGGTPAAEDPSLVANRVWIDSRPQKYTDYANAMYVVGYAAFGIFEKASAYDLRMERFDYRRDGGTLKVHFPQSGRSAEIKFTIRSCDELPPFNLCLELDQNPWGGPKKYYGLLSEDDEEAALGATRARIRALTDPPSD